MNNYDDFKENEAFWRSVKQNPYLKSFIMKHNLSDYFLKNNHFILAEFLKNYHDCGTSKEALKQACKQPFTNYRYSLTINNNRLYSTVEPCVHGQANALQAQNMLNRYGHYPELKSVAGLWKNHELVGFVSSPLRHQLKAMFVNPTIINKGFYLYGASGLGKSYFMTTYMNYLSQKYNGSLLINANAFINLLKAKMRTSKNNVIQIINFVKTRPYLAIDDLGSEYISAWVREDVWYHIINYRLENNKITFFTSNFSLNDLEKIYAQTKEINDYEIRFMKAQRLVRRISDLSQVFCMPQQEHWQHFIRPHQQDKSF